MDFEYKKLTHFSNLNTKSRHQNQKKKFFYLQRINEPQLFCKKVDDEHFFFKSEFFFWHY